MIKVAFPPYNSTYNVCNLQREEHEQETMGTY